MGSHDSGSDSESGTKLTRLTTRYTHKSYQPVSKIIPRHCEAT